MRPKPLIPTRTVTEGTSLRRRGRPGVSVLLMSVLLRAAGPLGTGDRAGLLVATVQGPEPTGLVPPALRTKGGRSDDGHLARTRTTSYVVWGHPKRPASHSRHRAGTFP